MESQDLPQQAPDGHTWQLAAFVPNAPTAYVLWLPALGVAAKHYNTTASELAARGYAVFIHEWRGNGTSNLRASKTANWGYRELLTSDIATSHAAMVAHAATQTPRFILGGHSLGGQLGCAYLGIAARAPLPSFEEFWVVAGGTPYWRTMGIARRWALPALFRFYPWLAQRNGYFPGRRVGFGGNEARGVIADWAHMGLTDQYPADIEAEFSLTTTLASLPLRVRGIVMAKDWLASAAAQRALFAKLPAANVDVRVMNEDELGCAADHFAWLKAPQAVAATLTRDHA